MTHDPFQQPPVQQYEIPKNTPPNVIVVTIIGLGLIVLGGLLAALRVITQAIGAKEQSFGLSVLSDGSVVDTNTLFRMQLGAVQLFLSSAGIAVMGVLILFHASADLRRALRIALTVLLILAPLVTTVFSPQWGGAIFMLGLIPITIVIAMLWIPQSSRQWFQVTPQQSPAQPQDHMPGQRGFYPGVVDRPASRSGPTYDQPQSPPSRPNSE